MFQKSGFLLLAVIFLASLGLAAWAYPQLPETIATHWDIAGEPNGFSSRRWGLAFGPLSLLVILVLYVVIPRLDPLRGNIEKFGRAYEVFFAALGVFLVYVYFLSLWYNLGHIFNVGTALIPALAALFFIVGGMLKEAKRNWFVGIRTPWTMSSDIVWEKTHKLGSILFKLLALAILLTVFFPAYSFWVIIAGAVGIAVLLLAYSYVEYRKIAK